MGCSFTPSASSFADGNLPSAEANLPALLRIRMTTVCKQNYCSFLGCCATDAYQISPSELAVPLPWRKRFWDGLGNALLISPYSKHPHLSVCPLGPVDVEELVREPRERSATDLEILALVQAPLLAGLRTHRFPCPPVFARGRDILLLCSEAPRHIRGDEW